MNEQIKILAQQAGGFVDLNQHVGGGKGCMVYTYEGLEQFARRIVSECADILDPNSAYAEKYKHAHVPGPDGSRTPLSTTEFENMQSAQKLREHFGVE
jgi:hypothetical protein